MRTTRTEFARFLDSNVEELDELDGLFNEYCASCRQQISHGKHFGYWLSAHYPKVFRSWYVGWWKKHPELWGLIYVGCEAEKCVDIPEKEAR